MNRDDEPTDRNEPENDRRPARRRRDDDDDRRVPKKSSTGMIIGIVAGVFLAMVLVCGGLIAVLLPAVSKVRDAAARAKSQNNMKQIGLAQHNFHDTVGGFVGPNAVDPTTKEVYAGHSWRVGLLPYIEQDSLYRGIDLSQPWDSPRNAQFTGAVVPAYRDPTDANQPTTATPYRVFVGGGALFNADGKPVPMSTVSDGLSNTIMIMEAFDTVPWAKPQELTYSPTTALPKFGSATAYRGGFSVMMADGSVRFMRNGVSDATMRKLIEKADGQLIGEGEW